MITIHKRTEELPHSFIFDSYNDHRFVMAWSLFNNYGKTTIQNSECVKKSYPAFNHLIITSLIIKSSFFYQFHPHQI